VLDHDGAAGDVQNDAGNPIRAAGSEERAAVFSKRRLRAVTSEEVHSSLTMMDGDDGM
jgi:hypothetical protein